LRIIAGRAFTDEAMPDGAYIADLFGLTGKTAVVMGGEGVLGGAVATGLARAGVRVLIAGIHVDNGRQRIEEIRALGGEADFQPLDVTRRDDLLACVERLKHEQRACDILVHAAGVNSATPFFDISDDEWDRILRINLTSIRLACQVFGKAMVEAGTRGSIINFASMSGITPLSRVFTYSVAKAGVINLTQNLAREWAPRGIRVNALSPGFFPAEQNRKILTPERVNSILGHTPMQRFGESHELIGAVLLLASNDAGGFITGSNLIVDGGFSAMTI
jgi:NAD(P)-dependent dehydrogenase (short-subunit alcohol dehydrogenase family)